MSSVLRFEPTKIRNLTFSLTSEHMFDRVLGTKLELPKSARTGFRLVDRGVHVRQQSRRDQEVVGAIDCFHAEAGSAQLKLLRALAEADDRKLWRKDGCRDMAQRVSGRLGISNWSARRWVVCGPSPALSPANLHCPRGRLFVSRQGPGPLPLCERGHRKKAPLVGPEGFSGRR